jgi:argininosuccinate lyase
MTLWGGRFAGGLDPLAARFNASLAVDQRLWDVDIRGSVAWSRALARAGVLTDAECQALCSGLMQVWAEFNAGRFVFAPGDEDIHTAVERRLSEIAGPVGGKLHTGRSRNDQVATDFRLWLMEALAHLQQRLATLQSALLNQAEAHFGLIMPGYTHLQRAQPVLFSHWLLSHFWPLERDRERLGQTAGRAATLPLGSGALAGTGFPIDREALARDLGFARISPNSIDGVADRDFAAEFLFAAALLGTHLSRVAEALIIFASAEFGFVEMSDAFAAGSSLMPQKKNPDMLELARGKAGTLLGLLAGLMATLKGLPSAYDKDLQEDKQAVFTAFDTLDVMLPVVAGTVSTMRIDQDKIRAALDTGSLATDLAEYLVRQGVPFRETHGIAGRAVRRALEMGVDLSALPAEEWAALAPGLDISPAEVFDFGQSVGRRAVPGGTAPEAVQAQLALARNLLISRQI